MTGYSPEVLSEHRAELRYLYKAKARLEARIRELEQILKVRA